MTKNEKTNKIKTLGCLRYIANLTTVSAGLVFIMKDNLLVAIIFGIIGAICYNSYEEKKYDLYKGEGK